MTRPLSPAFVTIVSVFLFVFICPAGVALAANGRIPIYGPTTISQPGSYYLTSDITNASGVAITIAANYVTLDLAGHTITQQDTADTISAIGRTGIKIYSGHINYTGNVANNASGVLLNASGDCTVKDLNISGPFEFGINLIGAGSSAHAIIDHNTVNGNGAAACGFWLQSIRGSRVENNDAVNVAGRGFYLPSMVSTVVAHNTASNSGFAGFDIGSGASASFNIVSDNLASNSSSADGFIFAVLANSVIDGNTATGNAGCGFSFQAGSAQNIYSNNRAIANTGGTYCGSTGQNTNAGGYF